VPAAAGAAVDHWSVAQTVAQAVSEPVVVAGVQAQTQQVQETRAATEAMAAMAE
jgi:hypothetical protein